MHARSALFDLYGDHLRTRGGQAPIAALVRLLEPLDVAAPAVRTAVSRMVRQGWLASVTLPGGPGYRLTERAEERLADSAARIYRGPAADRSGGADGGRRGGWDGTWDVLVLGRFTGRGGRERVRRSLGFLGYAPLTETTWVAAHRSREVAAMLAAEGVDSTRMTARIEEADVRRVVDLWDLGALAADYDSWRVETVAMLAAHDVDPADAHADADPDADRAAFALRSRLLHSWRKFLFVDPGLPPELLPDPWPGESARELFERHAERLAPAAARFVDACLGTGGADGSRRTLARTSPTTSQEDP